MQSWPGLARPSTPFLLNARKKDVDARDKRGHEGREVVLFHQNALSGRGSGWLRGAMTPQRSPTIGRTTDDSRLVALNQCLHIILVFRFALDPQQLGWARAMENGKHQAQPPVTILVIDDDCAVRNSLKFSLELEGFAVRMYANGRALLDDAHHLPTSGCLVVDQLMPGMSGLDVVQALRLRGISMPAVLITSSASCLLRQRAAAAGVAVVEKPFFGNGLVDTIRSLIAHSKSEPSDNAPRP
jgi:two-component system, LuxR family, response regulator FixJ